MASHRYQYRRDIPDDGPEEISRSQRKRDSSALQAKGEELAVLPASKQARLPLSPDLKEALDTFRQVSGHEAKRRQLQYVGRLMREAQEDGSLQAVLDAWAALD